MRFSVRALMVSQLLTTAALGSGPFDEADRLFAERSYGVAEVAAARAEYLRVGAGATGADLAYAVQQLGMLALYEGQHLLPDSDANRNRKIEIFHQCRTQATRLEQLPEQRTVYSYWRLACTALWMKYASLTDRLRELPQVKALFNTVVDDQLEVRADLGADLRYMGGGIYRVLAAIYSNSLSSMMRDNLPDGAKALIMVDRAMRSAAFPGDPNAGTDYYTNHRHKVEVLKFNQDDRGATQQRDDAIVEIEERDAGGELPLGLEPETRGELVMLRASVE